VTYGLTRLLHTEGNWADLVTYLAERDLEPLRATLDLPHGPPLRVDREQHIVTSRQARRQGSADIVVWVADEPAALLEVKLAASAHGDQFDAYDAWAETVGLPPERRYVVGPNADPIPGEPSAWSREHTIGSLLDAWAQRSQDQLARLLALEAAKEFRALDAEASGRADQVSNDVSDRLRIRRLYGMVAVRTPSGVELGGEKSGSGTANFSASRAVTEGSVAAEMQRSGRHGQVDCPFALRLLIRAGDGERAACEALAAQHEQWLSRRAFLEHAGVDVIALVNEPDGDGFKSERHHGKGSERYYGYEGAGQGSQTLLRDDATLTDMVTVATAAVEYLATF
jgi:hypothetical protein